MGQMYILILVLVTMMSGRGFAQVVVDESPVDTTKTKVQSIYDVTGMDEIDRYPDTPEEAVAFWKSMRRGTDHSAAGFKLYQFSPTTTFSQAKSQMLKEGYNTVTRDDHFAYYVAKNPQKCLDSRIVIMGFGTIKNDGSRCEGDHHQMVVVSNCAGVLDQKCFEDLVQEQDIYFLAVSTKSPPRYNLLSRF
jgi:hypothetical protein